MPVGTVVSIRRGNGCQPACWWGWKCDCAENVLHVMINCPKCRRTIVLGSGYKIASDGTVDPGVKCRTSYCDFEADVRLIDWER